jgi:argininosuccinate lyase
LKEVRNLVILYKESLAKAIAMYGKVKIPGYTHMRKAMPTTFGVWLGSFFDSAEDNLPMIDSVMVLVDQSPLGSAAGFGVPVFDIDKKMTAELMGFSKVMENPIYCQLSRGKFEAVLMNALSQIMFDMNKLSTDLMMFSMQEFGYVMLPPEICTGSSIMPQKKNPDVLELVRAKYHVVSGEEFKVKSMISNLMSGYNRDMQLTKEPLMKSIDITKDCLEVMSIVISEMDVDEEKCRKALSEEVHATEEAYVLVKSGESFRDAYQKISKKYSK